MEKAKGQRVERNANNKIPDYEDLFTGNESEKEKARKRLKGKVGENGGQFIRRILKMNIWSFILGGILYAIQYSPVIVLPIVTANIINIATKVIEAGAGIPQEAWRSIIINLAVLTVFLVQNIGTTMLRAKVDNRMIRRISAGIKCSLVRKLQRLSITYHKDIESGKLQSKFLKDTLEAENYFRLAVTLMQVSIAAVCSVIVTICGNYLIALFFLFVVPVNVFITWFFLRKIRVAHHDYRMKNEDVSVKMTNMLTMMPVTKAHGLGKIEISSIEKSVGDLTRSGLSVDSTNAKFGATMWVLNTSLSAVCLVVCVILALYGFMTIGEVVLYQSLFSQISSCITSIINIFPQMASGVEAINSISEIMNAKDVEASFGMKNIPDIKGKIEFENVYYKYPDSENYVVQNFNLKVDSGECIAVVGASGSGKSTIMNLIIGFLEPTSGRILIDDKPLTELDLSEYRHHLSVVPQNSILFSGTIRDNITYGLKHYTEEELKSAVDKANLNEFVDKLPKGLDTIIGENGDKLSGGQKQRITIARALIRNPRILILDEATSALDNISEYNVQKAISSSIQGRTTFIVAHRLSTIRDANRIVVMENGVAVEIGTYDELMAKKGKFYELKCLNEMNLKEAEQGLS